MSARFPTLVSARELKALLPVAPDYLRDVLACAAPARSPRGNALYRWRDITPFLSRREIAEAARKHREARMRIRTSKYWVAGYPHLVEEWHSTKNGDLVPADVSFGSAKRIWWKCARGPDHVWRTRAHERTTEKHGCPFCAGHRVSVTNSLATREPAIARQWHRTRNGGLTPRDVVSGSSLVVVWRCPRGPDHIWRTRVAQRTGPQRGGCPFCTSMAVSVTNSLAKIAPSIARQWHRTLNGQLRPENIVAGSTKLIWWECPKGSDHVWRARPKARLKGGGCPACGGKRPSVTNSIATTYPDLAREWHPLRNGSLTPGEVVPGSAKRIWWRCTRDKSHEWCASPNSRTSAAPGTRVRACPYCERRRPTKATSLAATHPRLAKAWHATKNALTPHEILSGSRTVVWWRCARDHEWKAMVRTRARIRGSGCPYCTPGHAVSDANSLAARLPALARQWHPRKNGTRTPHNVSYGSGYRAWWRCAGSPKHEWQASVLYRAHRPTFECPHCRRLRGDQGRA